MSGVPATYKITLQHVTDVNFQECYDAASGDLHQAFVLLSDKTLLASDDDPLSPTRDDRRVCLHLSELCRNDSSITSLVSAGSVFLTGPSGTLQPLEAAGHLEIQI